MSTSTTGSSIPPAAPFTIDATFPGGNVIVDGIDGDLVKLRPDLRNTDGNWFYWCFRVRGAAGRHLTFRFTSQDPIGARGPAVSGTAGRSWRWLGLESPDHSVFSYTFRRDADGGRDADGIRFSMGMTYTQEHLDRFLSSLRPTTALRREILCQSRKSRPVELLRLGQLTAAPRFRVLLTARHHACEMMASYELEGLILGILGNDRWLCDNVEFLAVPFVDKDGVEDGDQGKNRPPRDHNRDYSGPAIYPETDAIRRLIPEWHPKAPFAMLDLHCPWIRDGINEQIYQVGESEPRIWTQQQRFGHALEGVNGTLLRLDQGTLSYSQSNDLPFGQSWNTSANTSAGQSSASWAAGLPNTILASSIELPYANASGQEVTAASARTFGGALALALKVFLKSQQ